MQGKKPARYIIMSDIHGRREAFETVLCDTFKFDLKDGTLTPPDPYTHLIINGDLVDRGEDSPGMVKMARNLEARGRATIYRGNHEEDYVQIQNMMDIEKSGLARLPMSKQKLSEKKGYYLQYIKTYGRGGREQAVSDIRWFSTLPYFGDHGTFHNVHAFYGEQNIRLLKSIEKMPMKDPSHIGALEEMIGVTYEKAVLETLNGRELDLQFLKQLDPNVSEDALSYIDSRGILRTRARVKVWEDNIKNIQKFSDILMVPDNFQQAYVNKHPELFKKFLENFTLGPDKGNNRPLFMGHYDLTGKPAIQNKHVAILDFKGYMTAYVHESGQMTLSNSNLVSLKC